VKFRKNGRNTGARGIGKTIMYAQIGRRILQEWISENASNRAGIFFLFNFFQKSWIVSNFEEMRKDDNVHQCTRLDERKMKIISKLQVHGAIFLKKKERKDRADSPHVADRKYSKFHA